MARELASPFGILNAVVDYRSLIEDASMDTVQVCTPNFSLWFAKILSARNWLTGRVMDGKNRRHATAFIVRVSILSVCSSAYIQPLRSRTQRYECR
jgi:hypothetical protein